MMGTEGTHANVNAVVYARVSSKDQEREGFSIPAQLELLRSYTGHAYRHFYFPSAVLHRRRLAGCPAPSSG